MNKDEAELVFDLVQKFLEMNNKLVEEAGDMCVNPMQMVLFFEVIRQNAEGNIVHLMEQLDDKQKEAVNHMRNVLIKSLKSSTKEVFRGKKE